MTCFSNAPKEESHTPTAEEQSGFEIVGGCMSMPAEKDLVGVTTHRQEGVADHVGRVVERDHHNDK